MKQFINWYIALRKLTERSVRVFGKQELTKESQPL